MSKKMLNELIDSIDTLYKDRMDIFKNTKKDNLCGLVDTVSSNENDLLNIEILPLSRTHTHNILNSDFYDDFSYGYSHFFYTHDRRLVPRVYPQGIYECSIKTAIGSSFSEIAEVFFGDYRQILEGAGDYLKTLRIQEDINAENDLVCIFSEWLSRSNTVDGQLFLIGGELGSGRTSIANKYIDYVIRHDIYRSDNVIIIEDKTDFDVLLDKISFGRVCASSLVLIDELNVVGDMFAVNTLLDAGCDVIVVVEASNFSDMSDALLLSVDNKNAPITAMTVTNHLCYKLITSVANTLQGRIFRYSGYSPTKPKKPFEI